MWSQHVNYLSTKLNSASFNKSFLTNIISMETKITLYYVYLSSLMCYGISVWGGASPIKIY